MARNPRPCVCGFSLASHIVVARRRFCPWSMGTQTYRPAPRTEPLRARRRPTSTSTWPREPGPPPVKVIVRNESEEVVAVCYGTTEGVTLPSDLASGERYTLQPIFQSAPEVSSSVPVHLRVAE
jgi:hypothetical protein